MRLEKGTWLKFVSLKTRKREFKSCGIPCGFLLTFEPSYATFSIISQLGGFKCISFQLLLYQCQLYRWGPP